MLASSRLVGFVTTTDYDKARAFYEGKLGLRVVSQDQFALVLDSNGNKIRVAKLAEVKAQPFTVLGWEVANIEDVASELEKNGIKFENFNFPGQDKRGIWNAPGGDKVAWFKDPDGNTLSIAQHKSQ